MHAPAIELKCTITRKDGQLLKLEVSGPGTELGRLRISGNGGISSASCGLAALLLHTLAWRLVAKGSGNIGPVAELRGKRGSHADRLRMAREHSGERKGPAWMRKAVGFTLFNRVLVQEQFDDEFVFYFDPKTSLLLTIEDDTNGAAATAEQLQEWAHSVLDGPAGKKPLEDCVLSPEFSESSVDETAPPPPAAAAFAVEVDSTVPSVPDSHDPTDASVRQFLTSIAIAGLRSAIVFYPHGSVNLSEFVLPTRVVSEENWEKAATSNESDPLHSAAGYLHSVAKGEAVERFLDGPGRHVIIEGLPGEGKTTALWHYVSEACAAVALSPSPETEDFILPLFLLLGSVTDDRTSTVSSSLELIQLARDYMVSTAEVADADRHSVEQWIDGKIERSEVALFLDALDELPPQNEDWLRRALGQMTKTKVVITSRPHALASDKRLLPARPYRLRLVGFRHIETQSYLSKFFHNDSSCASEIRKCLRESPGLRQLCRIPLLLGSLCQFRANSPGQELPRSRTELLESAVRVLLVRGDLRFKRAPEAKERTDRDTSKLMAVAVVAHGLSTRSQTSAPKTRVMEWLRDGMSHQSLDLTPDELFDELEKDGILVTRGAGSFSLILRPLQEYLVAREFARKGGLTSTELLQLLHGPEWAPILHYLVGCWEQGRHGLISALQEEQTQEDHAFSRLLLLVQALAEIPEGQMLELRQEVQQTLIERVVGESLATGQRTFGPALGLIADDSLPSVLQEMILEGSEIDVGGKAALALALGEIGSDTAYACLIHIFDACDELQITSNIPIAIGEIGDLRAREFLQSVALGKSHTWIKLGAIVGLSKIADEEAIETILNFMMDPGVGEEPRLECIPKCEALHGSRVESKLLELLGSPIADSQRGRDDVQTAAAEALAFVGGQDSIQPLKSVLEKSNSANVLQACCEALGRLGERAALQVLLELANDPRIGLFASLQYLRSLNDPKILQQFLAELRERGEEHHRHATLDFSVYWNWVDVEPFVRFSLIHDTSQKVRGAAAQALGSRREPEARALLQECIHSGATPDVEAECRLALAVGGLDSPSDMDEPRLRHAISTYGIGPVVDMYSRLPELRQSLAASIDAEGAGSSVSPTKLRVLRGLAFGHGWRLTLAGSWKGPSG